MQINNIEKIKSVSELVKFAKWLEGKTLQEIAKAIEQTDNSSRVLTKGNVGYVIEEGFFGIKKNSHAKPDIESLGVELKTFPLTYNNNRTKLLVKEPLSLNIIDYNEEFKNIDFKNSSLYKKNSHILFIVYIHDKTKLRSEYIIRHVFLWVMDEKIIEELYPDYEKIIDFIVKGKAHEIHQWQHKYLTLCPKHSGTFKEPNCHISKRTQPFSSHPAEVRAYRLKNSYLNLILKKNIGENWNKVD